MALRALLEPYLAGIWTIARGNAGQDQRAVEAVVAFRDDLRVRLRRFTPDRPFGAQLYRHLWRMLSADLGPNPGSDLTPVYPQPGPASSEPSSRDAARIQAGLSSSPPAARLIYLFWVATDLHAPRLAELLGIPEALVRAARATVMARIQEAL